MVDDSQNQQINGSGDKAAQITEQVLSVHDYNCVIYICK